tara:strand:+ start:26456 stop:26623 length:168 start_codon:yes stop_codon:yes gene_type:complete
MDDKEDITITFSFEVAVAALASIEAAKDRVDPDRVEYKQRLYDAQRILMEAMGVN